MIHTDLTGGVVPNAVRFSSWLDGNDDEIIVEWWSMPGSFLRTAYNRRTIVSSERFEPISSPNYPILVEELRKFIESDPVNLI